MKRVLVIAVVAVLFLGACGDDDDGGGALNGGGGDLNAEEQEMADKISAELQSGEEDDLPLTPEQADCVGSGMVEAVGVEKLSTIDFAADEVEFLLSPEDAEEAADVMVSCVDIQEAFAESFTADGSVSQESAQCIADKLDDDMLKDFFAQVFQGNDDEPSAEFTRAITDGMTDCPPTRSSRASPASDALNNGCTTRDPAAPVAGSRRLLRRVVR
jgi:hypothetical protein